MSNSDQALSQFLPESRGHRAAILLGRTLAFCAHPLAAWQLLPLSWRVVILAAYAAVGFATVLGLLTLANLA
jgi:hypothetical protein